MKINKFTKLKDGMYKLYLDNEKELKIHEDLILKYELLIKKQLTISEIEKILEENKVYEAYQQVLKYLKVKMRSEKEIKYYLEKKLYGNKEISEVIKLLKKQGYLNPDQYIMSFIHDKIHFSNDGPIKIKEELKKHDLDNEKIDGYLEEHFTEELEIERIRKLIKKYIKTNHNKSTMLLKRKIQMSLQNLGYHQSLINQEITTIEVDEQSLYQKEYEKLYKKISKKYQGKELEYRIKQKLYQKGFIQ